MTTVQGMSPKDEETEEGYPAPEHTSRDPWPDGVDVPGPVAKLRALAEAHGWAVALTYSRGHAPHSVHGTPLALAHHFALRMLHPESKARCIPVYSIPVDKPAGKKWTGVLIVGPGVPPYAGCSITDAQEYVRAAGRVLPGWLEQVKWRNTLAVIRDKVWTDYHAGATLATMAAKYEQDKAVIMKIVQDCREAGKAKPGTRAKAKRESGG